MRKVFILAAIVAFAFGFVAAPANAGVNASAIATGSLSVSGQCLSINLYQEGFNSIDVSVTGTFTGTLTAETPTGSTIVVYPYSGGAQTTITGAGATSFAGDIIPGSLPSVQICMTAYTSGSATISMRASPSTAPVPQSYGANSGSSLAPQSGGVAHVNAYLYSFDGTNWEASTNGGDARIRISEYQNTSGAAIPTLCDQVAVSGVITTATSTQIVAAGGTGNYQICGVYVYSTGTNSADTVQLGYSGGGSCGSTTAAGDIFVPAATAATQPVGFMLPIAYIAFGFPSGQGLCVNTAGTTIAVRVVVHYATR